MISYIISCISCCTFAAVDLPQALPADAIDSEHDEDREMDFDDERDFANQGPLSDMDKEEDALILATLLKHIPTCTSAADIEELLQDSADHHSMVWIQLSIQVPKSLRSCWLRCDGICSSVVLV